MSLASGSPPPSAPIASFAASTFDFGTVQDGSVGDLVVVITNTGNAPLVVTAATSTGDFSVIDSAGSMPIASFAASTFDFGTVPNGSAGDLVVVITNTGNAPLVVTAATSTGDFSVIDGAGSPPVASFAASTFDFGTVPDGSVGDLVVVITNTGNAPLIVTAASATGDFAVIGII